MDKLIIVLFLGMSFFVKGQLDTEHWFAPMFDRNLSNGYYSNSSHQYIFVSTNEETPFDVEIYSGNTKIKEIKGLKKGNPQFYAVLRENIISKEILDLGKPITKGLYLRAKKKFFANLRFSTFNHAEILTSKGQAGIGTKFYAVVTPIRRDSHILNFMLGILATENQTKIKISGYKPFVNFTNISPTPQSIEITLNKGESYILEGNSQGVNKMGFIGAKIESDKPINITNGNFNGQYINTNEGSDIIMDQSVPVERLGNEFAIIKGNSKIGKQMEGAMIVATEDNTEIYVNNEPTPLVTLNEGEFYIVPDTKFVHQGRDHYNLYVRSTRNIYLYQLLGGTSESLATAGFNYIPPLNCFLPNKIGEIGLINEMYGVGRNGDYHTMPTKLNFITMKGAVVNVEGHTLTSENGPFPIQGTQDWVTYSIPDIKGNVNITSTKSITAGISAGSDAVGYGGYFAGFSTVVGIKRRGECIPNISLEVDGEYDAYQWKKNGVNIAGATSKTYKPTEPGDYSIEVRSSTCIQTTAETTVLNCEKETIIHKDVCGVQVFSPKFSESKQNIDISTLSIITQPQKGILNTNTTTGEITYTPNSGAVGEDSFVYQFCGVDPKYPDCEKVTVRLNLNKLPIQNAIVKTCPVQGKGVFDLTSADIGNTNNLAVKYYPTLIDANNDTGEIANPKAYLSEQGIVYVKAKSNEGCSAIVQIEMVFDELPKVDLSQYNAEHCDDNFDGEIHVDFSSITPMITASSNTVSYYLSETDAQNARPNTLPMHWSYSKDTEVFVRVVSPSGCFIVDKISFKIKGKMSLITDAYTVESICDTDFDAKTDVNLEDYISNFTVNKGVTKKYYATFDDAKNSMNEIQAQINIADGDKYYIRLGDGISCENIATITFRVKVPKASTVLADQKICPAKQTTLDAGIGFLVYKWSTGAMTQTITVGKGEYWVELTAPNGCVYKQYVKVIEHEKIQVHDAVVKTCPMQGKGIFDLTSADIGNTNNLVVKYYPTLDNANHETQEITTPQMYSSLEGEVYAKMLYNGGCSDIVKIRLMFYTLPEVHVRNYSSAHCDVDFDGKIDIDFSKITPMITSGNHAVKYYLSQKDAEIGKGNELPNHWSYSQNTDVFVRVNSPDGCYVIDKIAFVLKKRIGLISESESVEICDTDLDGVVRVKLSDYHGLFTQASVHATYYRFLPDAHKGVNALASEVEVVDNQVFYLRLENTTHCPSIAKIVFNVKKPQKSETLKDALVCSSKTINLNAGQGFVSYKWNTGETTQSIEAMVGDYWVDLTATNGCVYRQYAKVSAIENPKIESIDIKDNQAIVNVIGGTKPYEYSLDGVVWQSSNVFANLIKGKKYSVAVRAKNACEVVHQDFTIIQLVNLITPNGDGLNDVIDYSDLMTKTNAKFSIYDRYGALVFEGNSSNRFIWDGKAYGRSLPTSSYWYLIEWQEPNTNTWVKTASWILLKNKE